MIVKIRWNIDWILYDGFDKVHYRYYSREEAKKEYADSEWMESEESRKKKKDKPVWSVVKLICRKRSNDIVNRTQVTIKTDCPVYLLNNEGKTIEKIN